MARKKHIRSHRAAAAGKGAKAAGKVSIATNKIAATVAAVAVTGAFGAGAYALTQDVTAFNPDGFASAYGKDAQDSSKGYQATTEQTDAQANRHDDASQDKDNSAEPNPSKDAFSELPNNGSGTTAVAVDANAKPGTSTVVNDGNGNGGSSDGTGGNPSGPVIDNGSGDNNDDSGNGAETPGGNNNGGSSVTPPTPDTPNVPGGGNNNGGNNNGGGNSNGDDSTNEKPAESKPVDVTKGGDIEPEKGGSSSSPFASKTGTIGFDFSPTPGEIESGFANFYQAYDDVDKQISSMLYVGQKATAWDIFCAIDTTFNIRNGDFYTQYIWRCERGEFAEYSEKFFKIDSITCADGTELEVGDSTVTIPEGDFIINVSYSFDGIKWSAGTASYTPAPSRAYVINSYVSDGEVPEVLAALSSGQVNLLKYSDDIINHVAFNGFEDLFDENYNLKKLFLGWKEVFSNGDADQPVYANAFEVAGRHVYAPRGFADIDSSRFQVILDYRNVNNDGYVDDDAYNSVALQILVGIGNEVSSSPVAAYAAHDASLEIPEGVQVVDLEEPADGSSAGFSVDKVKLPSSVIYLDIASGTLDVRDGYEVSANSAYFTSDNGVLASKDGTQYLAVPSGWTELTVPDGVESVDLYSCNSGLKSVVIEATDPQSLPDLDLSLVENCDIVVKDEGMVDAAIEKYSDALSAQSGNSVSVDKEQGKYTVADNLKMRGDDLVKVLSGSSSIVDLSDAKKVCAGAFDGVSGVDTVVCGNNDIELEKDSFAGSSLKYVVCTDGGQAARASEQLENAGADLSSLQVVVKRQSQEGCTYFSADDGRCVLLKGSDSLTAFTGALTALDGSKVNVDTIGPRAFADCENLHWAVLDEDVKLIGARAFNGCASLEGLFIGSADYVTVEGNIFSSCDNVAFFASRAAHATFSGNEIPSCNAVMYCPTGSDGYTGGFQYFTPESGIADYRLVEQADGGYVLYGVNDIDQPFLCLSGYASMSGAIELPSTTTEIFNYAFANKGADEGFSINWEELAYLGYVDYNAFNCSKLEGDVVFVTGVNVGQKAFEGCHGITSLAARGYGFAAADMSFASCHSLASVLIESPGGDYSSSWVGASIFEDCPELKNVEFTSDQPLGLSLFGYGYAYAFNSDWNGNPDFAGTVKVPEASLQAYLDEWSYFFVGYSDYNSLANVIWSDLYEANGYTAVPTEQEIRDALLERLLPAENTLRILLGVEQVDEVTVTLPEIAHDEVASGCTFSVKDGVATLMSVSSEAGAVVDFREAVPAGCDEVVISANAFASAPNVKQVILSDKVTQIESGAFNGLSGLELKFVSASIPDLTGGYVTGPFAFGCDDMKITVDLEGYETSADKAAAEASFANDLLLNWPMQSLGYEDPQALYDFFDYLLFICADADGNVDINEVAATADAMLMRQENYFRKLLAMPEITHATDLRYSFSRDFLCLDDEVKDSKNNEPTPSEGTDSVPTPDTGEAGTGGNGETPKDPDGANDNAGGEASGSESGNVQDPASAGSSENDGNGKDEGAGTEQGGSIGDVEGSSVAPVEDVTE